jgi:LuxR family quorum sensing-dependent transcriptional regulator
LADAAGLDALDDIISADIRPRSRSAALTPRERAVLTALAEGQATEEIGTLLHVSPHTVRSRIKTILRKLGARNREHAVAIALRDGAIEPDL